MFTKDSTIFVSKSNYFAGEQTLETIINEKVNKNKEQYALSYHNGFNQYDYTQIESIISKKVSIQMFQLVFENPTGKQYKLEVPNTQKIYTKGRGYVDTLRLSYLDVFTDINDLPCKLVEKNQKGVIEKELVTLSIMYNKSAFINGILCKTQ